MSCKFHAVMEGGTDWKARAEAAEAEVARLREVRRDAKELSDMLGMGAELKAQDKEIEELKAERDRLRAALEAVAPTLSLGSKIDEIVQRALGVP